jgi:REP element-mobilizing transposase RayT
MARPLRLQFPGGVYHVTARGNDRRAIFEDDPDCSRFLIVLASVAARYRVRGHAYITVSRALPPADRPPSRAEMSEGKT